MLKKSIAVETNDPANPRIPLVISGNVLSFARMEPKYVRLIGQVGTEIKRTVTITREKDYPFSIVEAKPTNGRDIVLDVKEFSKKGTEGYILTVENKKTTVGRYSDTLVLTTDSKVRPTLTIPVYGQIISEAPKQRQVKPQQTDAGEG